MYRVDGLISYLDRLPLTFTNIVKLDVYGSDCKLLGLDDNKQVMLTFTRPHHPGARSVTFFAELFVRHKTSELTSEVSLGIDDFVDVTLYLPKHPLISELDQINWVPFEYNKELLFIPYLWPLTVVDMYIDKRRSVWHAQAAFYNNQTIFIPDTTVAKSVRVLTGTVGEGADKSVSAAATVTARCPWQHGRPRGSTPALLLPNGQYLGIFHSYDQLYRDQLTSTYMFGAYTFKAGNIDSFSYTICQWQRNFLLLLFQKRKAVKTRMISPSL